MEIYLLSYKIALALYKLTEKYPAHESQNIISQVRRAATSMPINIAEGSTKRTKREFLHYLTYSYGSAKELEVLLNLSKDLNYITEKECDDALNELNKFNAKIFLFLRNIENRVGDRKLRFFQRYNYKLGDS